MNAMFCVMKGAACGQRLRHGISRWQSFWGRWRRPWSRAIPWSQSPHRKRLRLPAMPLRWPMKRAFPKRALQLVTGGGDVGAALTADPRISGVVFTGSVPTAKAIARNLLVDDARPLVPLIAETGGLNAMFVDSTALVRTSGARCDHLRLPVGGTTLFGSAAAVAARGDCRAHTRDAGRCDGGAGCR